MRWNPISLTGRLTFWYSLSTIGIVFASTLFLYWSYARNLDFRDRQLLADKMEAIRSLVASGSEHFDALKYRVEKEWPSRTSETFFARVVDEGDSVIAQTPGSEAYFNKAERFIASSKVQSHSPMQLVNLDSQVYRSVSATVEPLIGPPHTYGVQIALDRSREFSALRAYEYRLVGVLLGVVLISIFISYQIARRGLLPVQDMAQMAETITGSNLTQRMEPKQMPAELAHLAKTFNGMLDRLKDSFERLQRFSADIAHELRTPVNNLTGEISVALGKERSTHDYKNLLGSSLEECGRLSRIIDSLLFLARADNPETQIVKESVSVIDEVQGVLDFYEASALDAGISCEFKRREKIEILVERTLFQRALGNLLSNAIKHTSDGGKIEIDAFCDGRLAKIEVRDTGVGIAPEHLPHLLDRFYRVDQSRSKDSGGTGLGLAIVKSIALLHAGNVTISSQVGRGTTVQLAFPLNLRESARLSHSSDLNKS